VNAGVETDKSRTFDHSNGKKQTFDSPTKSGFMDREKCRTFDCASTTHGPSPEHQLAGNPHDRRHGFKSSLLSSFDGLTSLALDKKSCHGHPKQDLDRWRIEIAAQLLQRGHSTGEEDFVRILSSASSRSASTTRRASECSRGSHNNSMDTTITREKTTIKSVGRSLSQFFQRTLSRRSRDEDQQE
jgi:hypothetical protein